MRPHTAIVVGYHGCDGDLARDLVMGHEEIRAQERNYHWLGSGVYFWENDQDRAYEWAKEKASRGEIKTPAVIGAVVELGRCLDMSVRENVPLVKDAHILLTRVFQQSGSPMPQNKPAPKDPRQDNVLRFLDCAVLNQLVKLEEQRSGKTFDTVRGLFVEGDPVYTGAEIYEKTHVEIAVRNTDCIRGLFLPL